MTGPLPLVCHSKSQAKACTHVGPSMMPINTEYVNEWHYKATGAQATGGLVRTHV